MFLLTGQNDAALMRQLSEELAQVECRFSAELLSDLACVNDLVVHVECYRGKMLRPTLVLATGLACGPPGVTEGHRVVATVVEMVHMATLIHDDILDEADIRRRGATVNRRNGNETAVMLGDYLISHAYHLGAMLGKPAITQLIGAATNTVCEGELLQLANRNNEDLDERTYFEIIRRKTASLCGTCCHVGAVLHDAPEAVADRMYDYGEKVGVAFQIVDDLLDLTGDTETVGKTLGRDLQKGKLTLPLIHCLRHAAAPGKRWLLERVREGCAGECAGGREPSSKRSSTPGTPGNAESGAPAGTGGMLQAKGICQMLAATGSVLYARDRAAQLVEEAKEALCGLPDQPAKALLMNMADAVVTRTF